MVSIAFRLQVVASFLLGLLSKWMYQCHPFKVSKKNHNKHGTGNGQWGKTLIWNSVKLTFFLTVHWAPNAGRTYRVSKWRFLCTTWFFMYFLLSNKKLLENSFSIHKIYLISQYFVLFCLEPGWFELQHCPHHGGKALLQSGLLQ